MNDSCQLFAGFAKLVLYNVEEKYASVGIQRN